jgi:hypothetical protein
MPAQNLRRIFTGPSRADLTLTIGWFHIKES